MVNLEYVVLQMVDVHVKVDTQVTIVMNVAQELIKQQAMEK